MRIKLIPQISELAAARFWAKVDKTESCWLFRGQTNSRGYGTVFYEKGRYFAHRFSWAIANGQSAPSDKIICHSCDNPPCVNPAHLWLGDHRDNLRDCVSKGRFSTATKASCKSGHQFTADNTYITRSGHRACRACHAARSNALYHEKLAVIG